MKDNDMKKVISTAMEHLPIPWEKLWIIFQKIIWQTSRQKKLCMKGEKKDKSGNSR